MRGRKKLFILAALLSAILIISVVFSSGVIDVSTVLLGGSSGPSPLASSTPVVSVESPNPTFSYAPWAVSNSSLQAGNVTEFRVNITLVTDLFAWQINMTWDTSVLNVSSIIAGEFLNSAIPPVNTSSSAAPDGLGFVINLTDNVEGYTAMGESILGGVPGQDGNGTLVTIEFLVVGYGSTNLTISTSGALNTTLLDDSVPVVTIAYDKTDGYFRNKYPGDVDGDYLVGSADAGVLNGAYGKSSPDPLYKREADFDLDGLIGSADAGVLNGAYGITYP